MNGINIVYIINKWLKQSTTPPKFENRNITIRLVDQSSIACAQKEFTDYNILYSIYSLELNIDISQIYFNTKLFFDIEDFKNIFKIDYSENNIGILNFQNTYFYYDKKTKQSYLNDDIVSLYLISNALYYIKLRDFLKSENFSDYYNPQNKEIVIYSSEKGIKKIKDKQQIVILKENKDYSFLILRLIDNLANPDYRNQFKLQLYFLEKNSNSNASDIATICENLEQIYETTENNYNIWSKKFSFDSLFSELRKQKDKYFNSLRDILSKILSQATSVPIAISASVFATYKVNDPVVLGIMLVAFIGYTLFAIRILIIYYKDVENINLDLQNDLCIIRKESGLDKSDIENQEKKVINKINVVKHTIEGLLFLFLVLSTAFLFFILYMLAIKFWTAIIISLALLFIMIIISLCLCVK